MRRLVLIVLVCMLILSGCSTKDKNKEPDISKPIETIGIITTPNIDSIETNRPIDSSKQPDENNKENPINSTTNSVIDKPQSTPNMTTTPIIKEQTIEDRLKNEISKAVDLEIQLKYPIGTDINNQYTKVKIIELLKSVSIVNDDIGIAIEINESNTLNNDEAIKLLQLILNIEEADKSNLIKISQEKLDSLINKYKLEDKKVISIDNKDIILVENNKSYIDLLTIPMDDIINNTEIITDLYNYTIYTWLTMHSISDSIYIQYNETVYRIKFSIQEYNEYKYSWNGISEVSAENNHLDEINSLYIEDIGSYIKVSMPKVIDGINPEFSYQFFISIYTNLLIGATELSSNGSDEISCILSKEDYNTLLEYILTTITELDTQHNPEYTSFSFDTESDCDESIHYKIATMSYLYNRLRGIKDTNCEVLIYNEGLIDSYSLIYYENGRVTKYNKFEYPKNLTKEQKRLCSRLYELSNYSSTKDNRYDMNNLNIIESLEINSIIKDIKTNKTDDFMIISYKIKDNTMKEIESTYKFLNTLTFKRDSYDWEFGENNTISLILDISDQINFNNKIYSLDINIDNIKLWLSELGCTVEIGDSIIQIICGTNLNDTEYTNILELAYRLSSNIFTKQILLYSNTDTYKGIDLIKEDGKVELRIINE